MFQKNTAIMLIIIFVMSSISAFGQDKSWLPTQSQEEINTLKEEDKTDQAKESSMHAANLQTVLLEAFTKCPAGGIGKGGKTCDSTNTWTRPNTNVEIVGWHFKHNTCKRVSGAWSVNELRTEEGAKYGIQLNVWCKSEGNNGKSCCEGDIIEITYK